MHQRLQSQNNPYFQQGTPLSRINSLSPNNKPLFFSRNSSQHMETPHTTKHKVPTPKNFPSTRSDLQLNTYIQLRNFERSKQPQLYQNPQVKTQLAHLKQLVFKKEELSQFKVNQPLIPYKNSVVKKLRRQELDSRLEALKDSQLFLSKASLGSSTRDITAQIRTSMQKKSDKKSIELESSNSSTDNEEQQKTIKKPSLFERIQETAENKMKQKNILGKSINDSQLAKFYFK